MTNVAVYGSLRAGMGNHSLLQGQTLLACTVTREPYAMYSLGGFPKVSLLEQHVPIHVEVYSVDDACLERLNRLEGFRGKGQSNFYDCTEIETECGLKALMYHIDEPGSELARVEDGDWVRYVKESGRRYY